MKRLLWILVVTLALIFAVVAMTISHISLSALPEPGKTETRLATRAKHFLVSRASRGITPPAPKDMQAILTEGDKVFGTDCSPCHGASGRKSTDAGTWMYPRAADLGSADVQRYSDAELFWIVKNGIRLSGMPAFGKVESDDTIWDLVRFIRTLPSKPVPSGGGKH